MIKLKTAAEYYNDNDTYTGTAGTKNNPYIIETVYDLCIGSDIDYTIYYMLANDINFNDHETFKYGITSRIIYNDSARLDGNGHSIYNMIFSSDTNARYIFQVKEIRNVNFVNLIFTSYPSDILWNKVKFYNCNFGVFINNSKSEYALFDENSFTDCTFNIVGNVPNYIAFDNSSNNFMKFNRCWLNFDIVIKNAPVDSCCLYGLSSNYLASFTNCAITGDIRILNAASHYDWTGRRDYYIMNSLALYNSYVALNFDCSAQMVNVGSLNSYKYYLDVTNVTSDGSSFIVNDLITKYSENVKYNNISPLLSLTSEEAKNSNTLLDNGFVTV